MTEEVLPFELPQEKNTIIKVLGIGGGGGNAINYMHRLGIRDVNFVIINTDSQVLSNSEVPVKVRIGESLTEGRGAGNKPEIGKNAAQENMEDIERVLTDGTKMVFVTAGMGGGTGTGAAPEIAKKAKELGILTVGIVTIPFRFEGGKRLDQAVQGVTEMSEHVDTLIVIDNEKLREMFGDSTQREAFAKADNILAVAAKGIAEIITVPGHLNVDFADVQTVMKGSGVALMGSAEAEGEERALSAIQSALTSPLLNNNDIRGAKNVLLNITSGRKEITMDEISIVNEYVQEAAGYTADLIWGSTISEDLDEKIAVTVVATGFETDIIPQLSINKNEEKEVVKLREHKNQPQEKPEPQKQDKEKQAPKSVLKNQDNDSDKPDKPNFEEIEIKKRQARDGASESEDEQGGKIIDTAEPRQFKRNKNLVQYNPEKYAENLEQIEDVPAFVRKGIYINDRKHSDDSDVSRFSLYEDKDNNTRISSDNSYLHDNVD